MPDRYTVGELKKKMNSMSKLKGYSGTACKSCTEWKTYGPHLPHSMAWKAVIAVEEEGLGLSEQLFPWVRLNFTLYNPFMPCPVIKCNPKNVVCCVMYQGRLYQTGRK